MKPLAFSRLEAAGKRPLGLLRMASPPATTPNPDFEKAIPFREQTIRLLSFGWYTGAKRGIFNAR
jgi:hypothetical protein